MFLDGFGLSGYRSFGEEVQKIGPLQKINFFIGQNNSGKSNILLFLKNHFHSVFQPEKNTQRVSIKFNQLDKCLGYEEKAVRFAIALNLDGKNYEVLKNKCSKKIDSSEKTIQLLDRLLSSEPFTNNTRIAWFPYSAPKLGAVANFDMQIVDVLLKSQILSSGEWSHLWHHLTRSTGGDIRQH